MSYRNLKSSDRSFIQEQNNRIIRQMSSNAEYLATNQAFEAAKSRMNEVYLAMEMEDDPIKKERLAKLVNKYADQALAIQEEWDSEIKAGMRRGRQTKFFLWILLLVVTSFIFPLNIFLLILFFIWWYRNYIFLKEEYKKTEISVSSQVVPEEEYEEYSSELTTYQKRLNDKIEKLDAERHLWLNEITDGEDDSIWVQGLMSGDNKLSESQKETGLLLLQRYHEILVEIEKLPDSEQKEYYLNFHKEMITDMEDLIENIF